MYENPMYLLEPNNFYILYFEAQSVKLIQI